MPVSEEVWSLLTKPSILSELEKSPTASPTKVGEELFGKGKKMKEKKDAESEMFKDDKYMGVTQEDMDKAASIGGFPHRPTDLFLKIYVEALKTLEHDPLVGMCSPSLLPSSGVIQLSICSVIPDIIRHMADCIVQAEHEVFLATNYWEASSAGATISDAIRTLSKRVGERGGQKIIMKMMYDRGTPKQVVDNRQIVPSSVYTGDAVKLPAPDEIPNVDLEVMNYHRPVVGTFHSKFMVVDRRLAICQSNNIQDRVNVEFMTHLEGPIVQSFYDLCLISWGLPLTPPLPLLASRPPTLNSILDSEGKIQQGQEEGVQYQFGDNHPHIKVKDLEKSTQQANEFMKIHQHNPEDVAEAERTVDNQQVHDEPTTSATGPTPQGQGNATPDAGETTSSPMPPTGSAINKEDTDVQKSLEDNYSRMKGVTAHLNTNLQPDTVGDVEDDPNAPPFRPHIIHSPHDPVPMAMVNRKPRGTPSPGPVDNPQGAAFLAGFKYATNKIFIQTPTFNATPVVAACLAAVRRGIEVTLYLDIGFNDAGEMLPMQGGTNEQVIAKMYAELDENVKKNLKVYWYTGKDQSRPMNASQKKRNCHVKIMIIDEAVGIQGNGNQDTQSWFHSQEVNVLVDSPLIMREWRAGLDANQNTLARGQVEYDGIWRDQRGQPLKDAAGPQKGGIMGTLNGFKGAIDRVRGTGGF